jgi:putative SOS response-associated peptidase YedK
LLHCLSPLLADFVVKVLLHGMHTGCAAAFCRWHGFYEWKAIKGQRAKPPYAIAMQDGSPFGIAGLWENWKDPASGEWIRTCAVITTDANELVADIHDRMPAILAPADYTRWLSDEPDPRDLMRPFPADLMWIWPISIRVNKPENDDPSIIEPVQLASDAA